MTRINKARYWWAVLYPENMVDDWQNKIDDLVQVPYAYCIHNLDTDTKSEHRKDHVHLMLTFSNTTTRNHAMEIFKLLGEKALNTCEAVVNVRHCYDYLIHDTESSKKAGKYQYDPSCRVTGNGFDIGAYEQIGTLEKREIFVQLCDLITDNGITNINDLYVYVRNELDWRYMDVMDAKWQRLESLTRGAYLKRVDTYNNIIATTTNNIVTEDGQRKRVEPDHINDDVLAGQGGCSDE